MASSVVLRQSLAATKRPLILQQLGASIVPFRRLVGLTHEHPTHTQHAARPPTLPTFPAVVRPSLFPLSTHLKPFFSFFVFGAWLTSDIQGYSERPDDLPPSIQVPRLVPLVLRAPPRRRPRPTHHSRVRHVRLDLAPPRWTARRQPDRPQPRRRTLFPPFLSARFDATRDSLTRYWWITSISASSLHWAHFSLGRCVPRRSLLV